MMHRKIGRKLNRTSSHRKALFLNLSKALIKQEIINTTLSKAKELRRFIEPLINLSKINSFSNRRKVLNKIKNKKLTYKLFTEIGSRFIERNGGYTRIYKHKIRKGDGATLAFIEILDRPKNINNK
jgi:large subunit ribosomal protein L17